MNSPLTPKDLENSLLARVKQGMKVYDNENHEIGKVKDVFLGEASHQIEEEGKGPVTTSGSTDTSGLNNTPDYAFGGAFDWHEDKDSDQERLEEARLRRYGYIRIDSSMLFAADRYALPEQIASVSGNRVTLKVPRESLMKS